MRLAQSFVSRLVVSLLLAVFLFAGLSVPPVTAGGLLRPDADNPDPPENPVRLVFVHHSTGGNWLADPAGNELGGGLGQALMENNYYASASNYGWGPDGIGDRTDIGNWWEWFRGPESARYLEALYGEDGQNFGDFGEWPRLSANPGGENTVIVFKSCFPNSDLKGGAGEPIPAVDDNPLRGMDGYSDAHTLANAQGIYLDLLEYFRTRPDKLFVVITAPPVSDPTWSANARALNNWLVNDWLAGYPYANVAVFDFYNVLTSSAGGSQSNDLDAEDGNHHRWWGGAVQHVQSVDKDTNAYPSYDGDDHPSRAGNQKATAEFIPLLNVFYHRWQANALAQPLAQPPAQQAAPPPTEAAAVDLSTEAPVAVADPTQPVLLSSSGDLVDDFEGIIPDGSSGWEAFWDETTSTQVTCAPAGMPGVEGVHPFSGSRALGINAQVAAGSWATCALLFDFSQDWSLAPGLSFYLHSTGAGQPFDVIVYGGTPDERATYISTLETTPESAAGWLFVNLPWRAFQRADWEADAGAPFSASAGVTGVAFGPYSSQAPFEMWVDDLRLLGSAALNPSAATPAGKGPVQPEVEKPAASQPQPPPAQPEPAGRSGPCPAGAIPLALGAAALWGRRRRGSDDFSRSGL